VVLLVLLVLLLVGPVLAKAGVGVLLSEEGGGAEEGDTQVTTARVHCRHRAVRDAHMSPLSTPMQDCMKW
jgi:hypothetical protein